MSASTAFLVGAGTVAVAIAGGLGGGLLIADMMSPSSPKHLTEAAALEQRTAPPPMPASNALPYTAATLAFTDPSIDGSAPPARGQADDTAQANNGGVSPSTRSTTVTANDQAAKPADHADAGQQAPEPQQGPAAKPASTPEDAYAKAADTDLKHAAAKDRAERARRWAYRHRSEHADQQARDDQYGDRSDGGSYYPYNYSYQRYRAPRYYEAPRYGSSRMFGPDD
jgi:hypothetical protein